MKKNILLMTLALFLAGSAIAQNDTVKEKKAPGKFGSFIRKAGEVTTGINMSDEIFIRTPFKMYADVVFVGCYGNSATNTVKFIFTVKSKSIKFKDACLVCRFDKNRAYDVKGNFYYLTGLPKSAGGYPEGVLVRRELVFDKIPSSLTHFELINLDWRYDTSEGLEGFEFRNIPIQWDVEE
jgi:hypothetical protein